MDKKLNKLIKIILVLLIIWILFSIYGKLIILIRIIVGFLLPFIVGFTIAFLLNPFVDKLESKGCNRKTTSCVIVIGIMVLIFGLIYFITPSIIEEGNNLFNSLPTYIQNIKDLINKYFYKIFKTEMKMEFLGQYFPEIIKYFSKILQSTFSYIISFIIGFILSIYFLIDYHKIMIRLKDFLVVKKKENVLFLLRELNKTMYAYFKGVILVMIVLSITSTICFFIIGIELPILWGIVIGITNIIPYIGPYIGGFIVGLFTLSSRPEKLLYVVLTVVILQLIESNFVTPTMESKTVKTHPIIVILFMMLFSEMLGIMGMLLAVPVLSIIQSIIKWQKSN
mgnify:CR=1 FL=1